jgi:hypothetical protein
MHARISNVSHADQNENTATTDEALRSLRDRNNIRASLTRAFKSVSVTCLPVPHIAINEKSVTLAETTPQSQHAIQQLRAKLGRAAATPLQFGGATVSVELLSNIVPALVEAVNTGARDICPPTMMEAIQASMQVHIAY